MKKTNKPTVDQQLATLRKEIGALRKELERIKKPSKRTALDKLQVTSLAVVDNAGKVVAAIDGAGNISCNRLRIMNGARVSVSLENENSVGLLRGDRLHIVDPASERIVGRFVGGSAAHLKLTNHSDTDRIEFSGNPTHMRCYTGPAKVVCQLTTIGDRANLEFGTDLNTTPAQASIEVGTKRTGRVRVLGADGKLHTLPA